MELRHGEYHIAESQSGQQILRTRKCAPNVEVFVQMSSVEPLPVEDAFGAPTSPLPQRISIQVTGRHEKRTSVTPYHHHRLILRH